MTSRNERTAAIVMAAGLGTRMRSTTPKVLHPVCGRPMLAYVLDAARDTIGHPPLVVYSPSTDEVRSTFRGEADFVLQPEPRGTGDAVRVALASVPLDTDDVVVLSGDVPLVDRVLVGEILRTRRSHGTVMAATVVLAARRPQGLGRVVHADGSILRVVEEADASAEERASSDVNAGLYAFDARWLRDQISRLSPSGTTGELYLTQLVEIARLDDRRVAALGIADDGRLYGINDRAQLAQTEAQMRAGINARHLAAGVTMRDPSSTFIDGQVQLAADVTLEPNTVLRGATRIGAGTTIGSGSQIVDSVVGERCLVWASVLESAAVEDDVQIGPFSHLRPGASIGRGAKLGNFAEVKNSRIGAGTQQHHFSYLGDATVGERVNIGAGTVTANYDGRSKHRTVIGDGAFIGSDTMLVAPIAVGEGSATGAGSVVTRDVPPGKVAVGMPARMRDRRSPTPGSGGPGEPSPDR